MINGVITRLTNILNYNKIHKVKISEHRPNVHNPSRPLSVWFVYCFCGCDHHRACWCIFVLVQMWKEMETYGDQAVAAKLILLQAKQETTQSQHRVVQMGSSMLVGF